MSSDELSNGVGLHSNDVNRAELRMAYASRSYPFRGDSIQRSTE